MSANGYTQIALYFIVLLAIGLPLGAYMARVYEGRATLASKIFGPVERLLYRLFGVKADEEMDWKQYAVAMLLFHLFGHGSLYLLQRVQHYLPLNPQGLDNIGDHSAFNTASSFLTNTNWQSYTPETTMSYLTQMLGLTVHNFVSAAAGMAILVAFIRGLTRREAKHIGNFWVDLTRSTVYILLPISFVFALLLVSQGVPQNLSAYANVPLLQEKQTYTNPVKDKDGNPVMEEAKDEKGDTVMEPAKDEKGNPVLDDKGQPKMQPKMQPKNDTLPMPEQTIALGPVASQEAIKELGTNGGGFFNANSAHPYENPTPLSNFLEIAGLLLISIALCFTFGEMVKDKRQGWAVFAAMTVIFLGMFSTCVWSEQTGNPAFTKAGVDQVASATQPGGNMEGKETRFGIVNSAFFANATTSTSCGAVNSMHDSYTPLGGMVPLLNIQYSEVIYGGTGCGLYGMLIYVIVTVFIAGLMVGRTPEYLGKKIESYEMKMACIVLLIPPLVQLIGTAIAVVMPDGLAGRSNMGAHGFSEILYGFTSATNNNGSAFAGLSCNTFFYNVMLAIPMLVGRFWLAIPVLAIAGSLASKKIVPASAGTLPTYQPLFVGFLVSVVIIFTALMHFPAVALGPIVEHLQMVQ
jgi:K+-transporting ATPase ATPase A chain